MKRNNPEESVPLCALLTIVSHKSTRVDVKKSQSNHIQYNLWKYAGLPSCRESDETIDTTQISVDQIWSYVWAGRLEKAGLIVCEDPGHGNNNKCYL